jgi:prevent-host-death family protein
VTRILSLSDVKAQLPKLVKHVYELGEKVIVTKNGRPAALLMNYDDYESLRETLEIMSDPEAMADIRRGEEFYARGGKGKTIDEVFGKEK